MLKALQENRKGIVFITVLIIIIVTMVLAISVLSLNISQVKSTEDEIRYIQAKMLSDGALARIFINQFSASPSNVITYTQTLGSSVFTILANITNGAGPTGFNSIPLDVSVTF